jgi:aryl-alcohol dehydrogenase-like predicted oxidoreductase
VGIKNTKHRVVGSQIRDGANAADHCILRDVVTLQPCLCHQNLELVNAVKEMAAGKGCSAGQLALAWVHAQGNDVFTIPGTKRVK